MDPLIKKILIFSLVPAIALVIAGIIAIYFRPNATWRSAILHFAAGVVFSVVAVEILPDIIKVHKPLQIAVGFSLGILLMLGLRYFTEGSEHKAEKEVLESKISFAFVIAIGTDILIDGILLGIGFAAGEKEGTMLSIALGIELLSLGLATSTSLRESGITKGKVIGIIVVFAIVFFASAALGATLLNHLPESALEIVLSFGLAALLFLVTEELLVEAHEGEESPWLTATFFMGFLAFLILSMMA
ncbi:MAG: transporter [Cytophagaceae bacterium]|nr:transporter [Cytophagaceae bacterium]